MQMSLKRVLVFLSFMLMVGLMLQQCWQSRSPGEKWLYILGDPARDYAGLVLEPSMQWLVFSVLAVFSMVFFRKRVFQKLRGNSAEYKDGLAGGMIRLQESLDPGQSCRQSYRGTDWTVRNRGDVRLEAKTEVKIDDTEGLTIIVSGNSQQSSTEKG